jgi:hypothetical protein
LNTNGSLVVFPSPDDAVGLFAVAMTTLVGVVWCSWVWGV